MSRTIVLFGSDRDAVSKVCEIVHAYVIEVLELRAGLHPPIATPQLVKFGATLRPFIQLATEDQARDEENALEIVQGSLYTSLVEAKAMMRVMEKIHAESESDNSRTIGMAFAHQAHLLEYLLRRYVQEYRPTLFFMLNNKDENEYEPWTEVADRYMAVSVGPDVDEASDHIGEFVEDILGMNPGE